MPEATVTPGTFFSVPVSMLETGTLLPCEIWVRGPSGTPVLYRGANTPFSSEHRQRLLDSGLETVLVNFADASDWNRHFEHGLRERINDQSLSIESRAQLLMDVARPLLMEVLDNPRDPAAHGRIVGLADSVCDLLRQPAAMLATVRLMEHDYYTYTHSLHVAIYSVALARACGIDAPDMLSSISAGGLMHDCGKCMLPHYLINKPGKLAVAEWDLMREHPAHGVAVLTDVRWDDAVVIDICGAHHERIDGSGYPRGLSGKAVPDVARLTAIADAYDAMTTDRAYQKARLGFEALKVLRQEGQHSYDQSFIETFIRLLLSKPV